MLNLNESVYPKSTLRIAVAQSISKDGDIPANVSNSITIIQEAAEQGADIVVFPEKFLTGYVPELINSDIKRYTLSNNDIRIDPIRKVCKENRICAIIGAPTRMDDNMFISSIIIDKTGEDKVIYNKTHLFYSEKTSFISDEELSVLNIRDWNIGLGICYDAGFSEHSRILAQAGCHVYMVSSLFSKGVGYLESRIWFPARALDNTMYAVMCNHVGKTGIWDACGSSAVWNPFGQIIAEASEANSELIIADLDPNILIEARKSEQMLADSFKIQYNSKKIIETRI